jgi:hypothetical protein
MLVRFWDIHTDRALVPPPFCLAAKSVPRVASLGASFKITRGAVFGERLYGARLGEKISAIKRNQAQDLTVRDGLLCFCRGERIREPVRSVPFVASVPFSPFTIMRLENWSSIPNTENKDNPWLMSLPPGGHFFHDKRTYPNIREHKRT